MWAFGKDCFLETTGKNRTDAVALDFLNKIQNRQNRFFNIGPGDIAEVKRRMQPATLEVVPSEKHPGKQIIKIHGEWGSTCTPPCNDPGEYNILIV